MSRIYLSVKYFLLTLAFLLTTGCATKMSNMIVNTEMKESDKPNILKVIPQKGKVALVVGRTSYIGAMVEFPVYLDKQLIGCTSSLSYFIRDDLEPGKHILTSTAENRESLAVIFEADKVYYAKQQAKIGLLKARVEMTLGVNPQQLSDDLKDAFYYEFDKTKPADFMSESDWKDLESNK